MIILEVLLPASVPSIIAGLRISAGLGWQSLVGAELIVPVMFGNNYKHAAPVLAILAWKIPFSALSSPYNGLLIVENRRRSLMWNNVAGASVNIVGDLSADTGTLNFHHHQAPITQCGRMHLAKRSSSKGLDIKS